MSLRTGILATGSEETGGGNELKEYRVVNPERNFSSV